ncbi:hypothetical protein L0244_28415 [bacterium]|nr:hypothetical protein [bacterium]
MTNFHSELLAALGQDEPVDAAQELLLQLAERFKKLSDESFKRVISAKDSNSATALGAGNQFIRSTQELMKVLKILGLIHPTAAKPKQLQDFFKKTKVIRAGKK